MSQQEPSPPSEAPGARPGSVIDTADADTAHAPGAWRSLMQALGRDLPDGIRRAEQARRRIVRMR